MREDKCHPNLAKGTLMAKDVKVQGEVIARGKVIGNDEVSKLNTAGVASIDVVRIGISDLLANAAVDHINRRLAGKRLLHIPARNGAGSVFAPSGGLLEYDGKAFGKSCAALKDFDIDAKPPGEMVKAQVRCVTTKTEKLAVQRDGFMAALAMMPEMQMRPRRQFKAALFGGGKRHQAFLRKVARMAEGYGSEVVHESFDVKDVATLTIALARSSEADLAFFCVGGKKKMQVIEEAIDSSHPFGEPPNGCVAGTMGSTTVIATTYDQENLKKVLGLVDKLHTQD